MGHVGRDGMYYEELHGERWERIALDGELLSGRAHHLIYFGNREDWNAGPEWARGRRDEIVDRIKSAFRIPDYEYDGEAVLSESDRDVLIEVGGGLSDEPCKWTGCRERALRGKAVCVHHAIPPHLWRELADRPEPEPQTNPGE